MPHFGEPVGRVKIQTTSKNSQRYYTTKRLIRDLLSNTPNCYVRARKFRGYLFTGDACQKVLRSRTELAREIQLTDRSTADNLSNRSSGVQIPRDICTRFGRYLYSTKCSWIIKCRIDPFARGGGGVLPYKRLLGMCRWMGSHFHDWIDYNGVAFLVELLEWGRTFSGFLG